MQSSLPAHLPGRLPAVVWPTVRSGSHRMQAMLDGHRWAQRADDRASPRERHRSGASKLLALSACWVVGIFIATEYIHSLPVLAIVCSAMLLSQAGTSLAIIRRAKQDPVHRTRGFGAMRLAY